MHRREFLLSASGIVGATTVGSIAYTSASVSRGVAVNVASDSNAVIGLSSGNVGAVSSGDQISIDPSNGNSASDGLNSNATFTYGNTTESDSSVGSYAFSVTNNDDSSHELTVNLNEVDAPGDGTFTLDFYDSTPSEVLTVTDGEDDSYTNWGQDDTLYAVLIVDTPSNNTNDFSGTMTLSV